MGVNTHAAAEEDRWRSFHDERRPAASDGDVTKRNDDYLLP